MKYINLTICCVAAIIVFSANAAVAQDKKMGMKPMAKDEMKMAEMHKDGHHAMMMAYHHNAVAFTRALWELSSDGTIENVDIARAAFAEIKRSTQKMDEIRKTHMSTMGKMDAAMIEKMKPMMEKMEAEKAAVNGHLQALENALNGNAPSASEIEMHSAALLMKLEKMGMPEKKMEME
ncbi:MAG: hypothetical protein ABI646_06700 [Acidobacteriota bacterium]